MNTFASVFALGLVLSAGSPLAASAMTSPDPCAVSASCQPHRVTAPAPVNCGLSTACIKSGIDNGGIHPVQAPAAMSPEPPVSWTAAIARMAGSFFSTFVIRIPSL